MMKQLAALLFAAGIVLPAQATEYRTVEMPAVLYDAPSQKGSKLFVIKRDTPVEVVISLEGWIKVRDVEGGLAWIEKKYLSERRSVIVTGSRAEVRQTADDAAALIFEAEKNVSLDYVEIAPGGWVKVRHRSGQAGFVRATQVWGL
jgi:SH3-like domain-containing protein